MHPPTWTDIRYALAKRGYTLARISRELGHLDPRSATGVRRRRYPLVEQRIAEILGMPPHHLWPNRYRQDGSPIGNGVRRRKEVA